jgi:hypothetical protein
MVCGQALVLGATLALAACGGREDAEGARTIATLANELAPCPRIVILGDGADLTRFRPGGDRDLTAMVVDARIEGFNASCDYANSARDSLAIRLTPRFEAERGPAAEGRTAELPWFVALTDPGDQSVLDRRGFAARASFPPNTPRATVIGQQARLAVPLRPGARAQDYTIRLSFQLSPEELAHNRARGPR